MKLIFLLILFSYYGEKAMIYKIALQIIGFLKTRRVNSTL
jgi:hypothetical protein